MLWQVGHGRVRDEDELYALARGIDWTRHFNVEPDIARRCRGDATRRCRASNSRRSRSRTRCAIASATTPAIGRPSTSSVRDVRVHAYLTAHEATIYLDTSGEPVVQARLAARLRCGAAARESRRRLDRALGLGAGTPLPGPMCGSGTIAIEAATVAARIARRGLQRTFGFQKLRATTDRPGNASASARAIVCEAPAVPRDHRAATTMPRRSTARGGNAAAASIAAGSRSSPPTS